MKPFSKEIDNPLIKNKERKNKNILVIILIIVFIILIIGLLIFIIVSNKQYSNDLLNKIKALESYNIQLAV